MSTDTSPTDADLSSTGPSEKEIEALEEAADRFEGEDVGKIAETFLQSLREETSS